MEIACAAVFCSECTEIVTAFCVRDLGRWNSNMVLPWWSPLNPRVRERIGVCSIYFVRVLMAWMVMLYFSFWKKSRSNFKTFSQTLELIFFSENFVGSHAQELIIQ